MAADMTQVNPLAETEQRHAHGGTAPSARSCSSTVLAVRGGCICRHAISRSSGSTGAIRRARCRRRGLRLDSCLWRAVGARGVLRVHAHHQLRPLLVPLALLHKQTLATPSTAPHLSHTLSLTSDGARPSCIHCVYCTDVRMSAVHTPRGTVGTGSLDVKDRRSQSGPALGITSAARRHAQRTKRQRGRRGAADATRSVIAPCSRQSRRPSPTPSSGGYRAEGQCKRAGTHTAGAGACSVISLTVTFRLRRNYSFGT